MDNLALEENGSRRGYLLFRQFNWRMVFIRVLVNGLSLMVTAALLPEIYLIKWTLTSVLFLGAILGLLNAFIRPVLQFLTLSFIFVTYGLVIVMINTAMLLLLAILLPGFFAVDSLFWATVGGVFMGFFAAGLESLFGLSLPILPAAGRPVAGKVESPARSAPEIAPGSRPVTGAAAPPVKPLSAADTPAEDLATSNLATSDRPQTTIVSGEETSCAGRTNE